MKTSQTHRRAPRGFTLIEMIATMVVLSVVGTASVGITWTAIESFGHGATSLRLHSEASVAMERMTRELRAISLDEDDTPDIQLLRATSVTWSGGTRSIALVGDELIYTNDGTSSVLSSGVTAFTITAHDAVDATLVLVPSGVAPDTVRRLTLELGLADGEASATVRTKIFLRCMSLEDAA